MNLMTPAAILAGSTPAMREPVDRVIFSSRGTSVRLQSPSWHVPHFVEDHVVQVTALSAA